MNLRICIDRLIISNANNGGGLEIIDDVGASSTERDVILGSLSVPTQFVDMSTMSRELWDLLQSHVAQERVMYILPGNGAWLVERALNEQDIFIPNVMPVDISRDGAKDIHLNEIPDRFIVIEDVVETGETARRLYEKLRGFNRPVILATMLWHNRAHQTAQVLDAFKDFDEVYVGIRINSSEALDDVRSLSTLARKVHIPKNQRYAEGRESSFVDCLNKFLNTHSWVRELGNTLGYRKDHHAHPHTMSS